MSHVTYHELRCSLVQLGVWTRERLHEGPHVHDRAQDVVRIPEFAIAVLNWGLDSQAPHNYA